MKCLSHIRPHMHVTDFSLNTSVPHRQCHSTSVPYSFIHLSPMMYNLGNWQLWLRQIVINLSHQRSGFDPRSVHEGFVVDRVALCLWQRQYVVNFEEWNLMQVFRECDWNFICVPCCVVPWDCKNKLRGCWGRQVLVLSFVYLWILGMPSVGPTMCVLMDFGDDKCWSYPLHTRGCWGCQVLVLLCA